VRVAVPRRVSVYGVPLGETAQRELYRVIVALRRRGIAADLAFGGKGLKGAMKGADRSGAAFAVVLGERDLESGHAQVKDLTTGEQTAVPIADVVRTLEERLQ